MCPEQEEITAARLMGCQSGSPESQAVAFGVQTPIATTLFQPSMSRSVTINTQTAVAQLIEG